MIYNKTMRKVAIENDGTKAKILLIGKDGEASYRELPRGIITIERLKEYENPTLPSN